MSVACSSASPMPPTSLDAKLQKLNNDIQLQQHLINSQKESVMKTRQKLMQHRNTAPKVDPDAQLAYMQIMISQHREMLISHYKTICQHKQMVKEQELRVQNLTAALSNIRQGKNIMDNIMNTRMAGYNLHTNHQPEYSSPDISNKDISKAHTTKLKSGSDSNSNNSIHGEVTGSKAELPQQIDMNGKEEDMNSNKGEEKDEIATTDQQREDSFEAPNLASAECTNKL